MKPLYRRILVLAVAIIIVLGAYTAYHFFTAWQIGRVPREFSEARSRGGVLSQEIVANSNEVASAIAGLNDAPLTSAQASTTIGGILDQVSEIKSQALQLARELETMTRSLPDMRAGEARDAALTSVTRRVELVSNLIEYTDQLTLLASALRLNLESGARNSEEISQLIDRINAQAAIINDLNRSANESMERFDDLLR